uniref:Immunoglobulin domain-containing protein n=2 Tax=Pyxicephalus adspersus TaxID=30357 RepID=A0AAV3A1Q0_PYXAD|nr:TPA: hypothetical protein GDO54_012428 [Pyxicephalus adspersus]
MTIEQNQISVTHTGNGESTAYLRCIVHRKNYLHWYVQKNNGELKRILYIDDNDHSTIYDDGATHNKFVTVWESNVCSLIIKKIMDEDAGTYYCALWYYSIHTDINQQKHCTNKGSVIQMIRYVTLTDHKYTTDIDWVKMG